MLLRKVRADLIYDLIEQEHVTHYCGAPTVHYMLVNAPDEVRAKLGLVKRAPKAK